MQIPGHFVKNHCDVDKNTHTQLSASIRALVCAPLKDPISVEFISLFETGSQIGGNQMECTKGNA